MAHCLNSLITRYKLDGEVLTSWAISFRGVPAANDSRAFTCVRLNLRVLR
jgi:hypothetical protein